jgi:hypothetical protein
LGDRAQVSKLDGQRCAHPVFAKASQIQSAGAKEKEAVTMFAPTVVFLATIMGLDVIHFQEQDPLSVATRDIL